MKKDINDAMRRAAGVRLLCLDVDGTLTDGKLYMSNGVIGRAFNVLDGLGVQRFIDDGGVAAIITAAAEDEGGVDIRVRAKQMGILQIHIGARDKLAIMRQLLDAEGLDIAAAGFVGDDLPDLAAMQQAGFAAAPATAAAPVREAAQYIPELPAGGGAVRDICEFILAAKRTHIA